MNVVCLVGNMVADAELKYTASGVALANLRIAVNNPYHRDENNRPKADYFNVTCWRQSAEFIANYGGKGREISIVGRLQQRQWTTPEGQQRSVVEVQADNVRLVGPRPPENGGAEAGGGEPEYSAEPDYAG